MEMDPERWLSQLCIIVGKRGKGVTSERVGLAEQNERQDTDLIHFVTELFRFLLSVMCGPRFSGVKRFQRGGSANVARERVASRVIMSDLESRLANEAHSQENFLLANTSQGHGQSGSRFPFSRLAIDILFLSLWSQHVTCTSISFVPIK